MTKAEADILARQIFKESAQETIDAMKNLKSKGWKPDLDGTTPPELKAIDDECRRKIKELAAQIED